MKHSRVEKKALWVHRISDSGQVCKNIPLN